MVMVNRRRVAVIPAAMRMYFFSFDTRASRGVRTNRLSTLTLHRHPALTRMINYGVIALVNSIIR
jgi:hypothetical protein